MFDFRLKVFQSVAQNRSFTKASKELFISQPAISKHIQELELQYKTPLFERTGNRVRLTKAGELLASHAAEILADYRRLEFEMNLLTRHFSGALALGASTTIAQYILPPILSSFIQKFPEVHVSLINGNSREIEQAVTDDKITLGLVEGNTRLHTLHYTPFMKDELVVVTHSAGKLAELDEITLEQLCRLPLVLRENGSGTLAVFESELAARRIKLSALNVLLQLGSTESIKRFLENCDCLGVLSVRAVSRELASGKLKVIDVTDFTAKRMFSFVEKQGRNGGMEESFIRFSQLYNF
ncbi:MAG: LysR family transcriptional regulator [Parabacteroides sp.]|nr:LysR family transcriptional regulator [Parabacteroides sp.]